ncbi:MAG: transglycosylase [Prolixibacteraceae bacterium]|nr:transglycosylase [Prolixibacteraceae bacterium]
MKKIGIILLVLGLVGLIYFGYVALQASESFSILGVDVAVSDADWNPVIFSGIVAAVGIVLALVGKRKL